MKKTKASPRKPSKTIHHSTGDKITVKDVGSGASVAAGRGASASVQTTTTSEVVNTFNKWAEEIEKKIDAQPNLGAVDKQDLKEQAGKIKAEANKGKQADPDRLEKLLNTLAVMSQDIFDVAVTTIANPLLGIGLVVKKISERARIEQQGKTA